MINKDTLIKVINKDNGVVGYTVPDLGVHRNFYPGETKEVTYEELEKLSFIPGGMVILKELLEITDREATRQLFSKEPEPEYHYTKDDVKQLLLTGTLDQFLDCLDFAPEVIKDMVKDMAVDLPLNDMAKRQAIQEKLGFNVTNAIENLKIVEENIVEKKETMKRRAAVPSNSDSDTSNSGSTGARRVVIKD